MADGWPVVWLARKLGMPLKERAAGADLFDRLRSRTGENIQPVRVFFFGGRDGAAERAHQVLSDEDGSVVAAGWHNPGFGDVVSMSSDDVIQKSMMRNPILCLFRLAPRRAKTGLSIIKSGWRLR